MILLRSYLTGHIRIKRALEYYDAGIGPRVPFGGGFSPVISANFAVSLGDYTTLSTVSSMPTGGAISRAGNAMLYDSTGKLTYAPNNLLLQSQSFSSASWIVTNATKASTTETAPDSTNTALLLQFTTTGGRIAQTITVASGVRFVFSVWVKVASGTRTFQLTDNASTPNVFGSIVADTSWQRLSVAFAGTGQSVLRFVDNNASGFVDTYLWGAQLEAVTYQTAPSTYIPTTSAAYYGPRFDYNPSTLAAKGLLVEAAATNLAVYSQTPSDASWSVNGTTKTSTNNADPFGTSTALLLTASGGVASHSLTQSNPSSISYTSGVTYVMSCYVKSGTAAFAQLTFNSATFGAAQYANFSLSGSGSVTASSGGTAAIVSVGSGWYRISWSAVCSASATSAGGAIFFIASGTDARAPSFASTDTLYVVGWQVEAGSFATSYIPTTTASVTRAAETLTLANYQNRLIEEFYIDAQTGNSYTALSGPSATSPLTVFTGNGWVTSLRAYNSGAPGTLATPSWLDVSATTGNRMLYDSTGRLTYAPANILLQSQFAATWSAASATVVANTAAAPDGTTTAATLTATGGTGYISQNVGNVTDGVRVVVSLYAKKSNTDFITVRFQDRANANNSVWFNLATGAKGTSSGSVISYDIASAGNGWYRVYGVFSAGAGATTPYVMLRPTQTDGGTSATNDAVFVYGAQLEAVTYQTAPSAYIPTTTAAYYGPRFDYDPSTLAAKGLLIEESRVNLCRYSQDLTNAAWSKTDITIDAGSYTTPDGNANRCLLTAGTAGTEALTPLSPLTVTVANPVTFSVYAKYGNSDWLYIQIGGSGAERIRGWFNLNTGVKGTTTVTAPAASASNTMTPVGNGWYRCTLTGTLNGAGTTAAPLLATMSADGSTTRVNGATKYIWGAQLEAGSFATSYIPTVAASVTRVADIIKLSGAALTTAGAATGSAIVQTASWLSAATAADVLSSATTRRLLYSNGSNTVLSSTNGTTGLNATIGGSGTFTGGAVRSAIAWNASGRSLVANNGTLTSDAVNLGTNAAVTLGGYGSTTTFDGWVAALSLYNQRLPDATLQSKSVVGSPL